MSECYIFFSIHSRPDTDIGCVGAINGYAYDLFPSPDWEDGDNYILRISQGNSQDFSPAFAVSGGRAASTSTSASSTFTTSTTTKSSTSAAPTYSVTEAPSAVAAQTTSSSSNTVEIIIATPTSSFDAPREEDHHMTINDKLALGFGIPALLIVLSTLGYWRATKYFLHRKITGEPRLPVYGSYEEARQGSNPDFRGSWSSRPTSLWGAASRRGSVMPPVTQGDFSDSTELLTAPKIIHTNPDARLSQSSLRAPSTLRQEWRGV
jgi:hypothetical protein